VAVSVTTGKIVLSLSKPFVERFIQILDRDLTISLSRAALISEEKILRHRVRLIPGPRFILPGAPTRSMLYRVTR
jgi:hypothetical protein